VSGSDGSQGDDLEARARSHNSTLQSLIDAVGVLLSASRELLTCLQGYLPKEAGQGAVADHDGPPECATDKPPDAQQNRCRPACMMPPLPPNVAGTA
jgi:hypothetical protein